MNTLPVIWVLMGLRFMGASPSQEGKWLPYEAPISNQRGMPRRQGLSP